MLRNWKRTEMTRENQCNLCKIRSTRSLACAVRKRGRRCAWLRKDVWARAAYVVSWPSHEAKCLIDEAW